MTPWSNEADYNDKAVRVFIWDDEGFPAHIQFIRKYLSHV